MTSGANINRTTPAMTDGTKYRSNFFVNFCVGETRVSASLTIVTTRANVFSDASLGHLNFERTGLIDRSGKDSMFRRKRLGIVDAAAATSSTGRLSTGTLSPVIGAWLMLLSPTMTKPSAGTRSSGLMMTTSPHQVHRQDTSDSVSPRRTRAVSGVRSDRASIAAVCSSHRVVFQRMTDAEQKQQQRTFRPRSKRSRTRRSHDHQKVNLELARTDFLNRFGDSVVAAEEISGDKQTSGTHWSFGERFHQPTSQQKHAAQDRKDELRLGPKIPSWAWSCPA